MTEVDVRPQRAHHSLGGARVLARKFRAALHHLIYNVLWLLLRALSSSSRTDKICAVFSRRSCVSAARKRNNFNLLLHETFGGGFSPTAVLKLRVL